MPDFIEVSAKQTAQLKFDFLKIIADRVREMLVMLTNWGRVTHICVNKQTIIGSDNGMSPGRRWFFKSSMGIKVLQCLPIFHLTWGTTEIEGFLMAVCYLKNSDFVTLFAPIVTTAMSFLCDLIETILSTYLWNVAYTSHDQGLCHLIRLVYLYVQRTRDVPFYRSLSPLSPKQHAHLSLRAVWSVSLAFVWGTYGLLDFHVCSDTGATNLYWLGIKVELAFDRNQTVSLLTRGGQKKIKQTKKSTFPWTLPRNVTQIF